jgi:hypothetical protein
MVLSTLGTSSEESVDLHATYVAEGSCFGDTFMWLVSPVGRGAGNIGNEF